MPLVYPKPIKKVLTSVFTTSDEENMSTDSRVAFDTDSTFWVCDNSATGHVCNDKALFHGPLVPSRYQIGSATGTTSPDLMGTVILWAKDDNGIEHTFTLNECVLMDSSPVNIFSTRRLAEHFPDEKGNPDRSGTGITSLFDEHTLMWNQKKFTKTLRIYSQTNSNMWSKITKYFRSIKNTIS